MPQTIDTSDASYRRNFLIVQVLTLIRIPIGIAFAVLLLSRAVPAAEQSTFVLLCGLGLLLLCEATDFLDGRLARGTGVRSEWGAMLDPYADSITRIIIFWTLAGAGLAMMVVPLALAVRDITVAYSRIVLTKHGRSVAANWSGKAKAVVQAGGSWLLLLGPLYWEYTGKWPMIAISIIVLTATLASAVQYVTSAYSAAVSGGEDDSR